MSKIAPIFIMQLVLNAAWSWIFFYFHAPFIALLDIGLLIYLNQRILMIIKTNCIIKIGAILCASLYAIIPINTYSIGHTIPKTKLGGLSGLLLRLIYQSSELIYILSKDPITEVTITKNGKRYFISLCFFY